MTVVTGTVNLTMVLNQPPEAILLVQKALLQKKQIQPPPGAKSLMLVNHETHQDTIHLPAPVREVVVLVNNF